MHETGREDPRNLNTHVFVYIKHQYYNSINIFSKCNFTDAQPTELLTMPAEICDLTLIDGSLALLQDLAF